MRKHASSEPDNTIATGTTESKGVPDRAGDLPPEPAEMVIASVVLNRPSAEELDGHNRAEKYQALRSNSSTARERLIAWIDERGLSDDVVRVSAATAFNLLFVEGTQAAVEQLADAPGVLEVNLSPEFDLNLGKPAAELPEPDDPVAPGDDATAKT